MNFQKSFSPIVKWESIRYIISIATHQRWPIFQMDIVTTFFNGDLKDPIFMTQPLISFIALGQAHLVCSLKKSLYELH